jgi:hypothetical protein
MKRLDQGHLHPKLEGLETDMSRPGIEPGGGEHSRKGLFEELTVFNCYSEPIQYGTLLSSVLHMATVFSSYYLLCVCCAAMYPSTSPACFQVKSLLRPATALPAVTKEPTAAGDCAACTSAGQPHTKQQKSVGTDNLLISDGFSQCCGFVTFWYRYYSSGSADPYH